MRHSTIIFLFSALLLLASCAKPKELVYKDYKNFKVSQWGVSSSKLSLDLIYYNPNKFGLKLKDTDADVFIDGALLGHFRLDSILTIKKLSDFTFPVNMDVDMKNIFKNGLSTLLGKEVTITVKGTTRAGKAGIFLKMPVKYEGKHKFDLF